MICQCQLSLWMRAMWYARAMSYELIRAIYRAMLIESSLGQKCFWNIKIGVVLVCYNHISISISIYLSIYLFIYLLSIYLPIYVYIYIYIYIFISSVK